MATKVSMATKIPMVAKVPIAANRTKCNPRGFAFIWKKYGLAILCMIMPSPTSIYSVFKILTAADCGLSMLASSFVSVPWSRLVGWSYAGKTGEARGRRLRAAAGGGVAANVREMVEMRANNNYQKHRRWRQKVGEKNKIENDHKRGFSDTKYLHIFFFFTFFGTTNIIN